MSIHQLRKRLAIAIGCLPQQSDINGIVGLRIGCMHSSRLRRSLAG